MYFKLHFVWKMKEILNLQSLLVDLFGRIRLLRQSIKIIILQYKLPTSLLITISLQCDPHSNQILNQKMALTPSLHLIISSTPSWALLANYFILFSDIVWKCTALTAGCWILIADHQSPPTLITRLVSVMTCCLTIRAFHCQQLLWNLIINSLIVCRTYHWQISTLLLFI